MKKKAMSSIVATVLIILIVVIGVSLVWSFVVPMVSDFGLDASDVDLTIMEAEGYTVYDSSNGLASVQVKRGDDEVELFGIKVVFVVNGTSVEFLVPAGSVPAPGTHKLIKFNLSVYGEPESVDVFPVVELEDMPQIILAPNVIAPITGNSVYGVSGLDVGKVDPSGEIFNSVDEMRKIAAANIDAGGEVNGVDENGALFIWGDINGDCVVDATDVGIVEANMGVMNATFSIGDANRDGRVDRSDLDSVNWHMDKGSVCRDDGDVCNDTDGGVNFAVKGKTINLRGSSTAHDYCRSNITLEERFCYVDGMAGGRVYDCPNGCVNDACVGDVEPNVTVICSDSDGGIDISIKGTVQHNFTSYIDYCNGSSIVEYLCNADGSVGIASMHNGGSPCTDYGIHMVCDDGRCLSTQPDSLCIDTDWGVDYSVRGTVTGAGKGYQSTDYCEEENDSILVEYSCYSNLSDYAQSDIHVCENGCVDGACVEAAICGDGVCEFTETFFNCEADCYIEVTSSHQDSDSGVSVYGEKIVWSRSNSQGTDIYMCDLSLNGQSGGCLKDDDKTRVTTEESIQDSPKVFEDIIVWRDYRNKNAGRGSDIYMCDLSLNGQSGGCLEEDNKTMIAGDYENELPPVIYGNRIAWIHNRRSKYDVYTCDLWLNGQHGGCLKTDTHSRVTIDSPYRESLSVFEDVLVWTELLDSNSEIIMCDLSLNGQDGGCASFDKKTRLTSDFPRQNRAYIFDNVILWQEFYLDSASSVRYDSVKFCNLSLNGQNGGCLNADEKIKVATIKGTVATYPKIYGDNIFWSDSVSYNTDIYMCRLSLNGQGGGCLSEDQKIRMTTDQYKQKNPSVYKNKLVWYDSHYSDISLAFV
ncbi:hypothetical protein HN935_01150 [archaeon]|jgi:beta propeller repeat protein|nr:hypothetical protein [archaeon]